MSKKLKALGHAMRLAIISLLASEGEEIYFNEIADRLDINMALAKDTS
jgi:DNA-binding transcriptional ArsR family regulator